MMKKKVKKIPKFAEGTPFYKDANFYSQTGDFLMQQVNNIQQSKQGVTAGGIAKGALSGAATGAAIGSIVPGIGTAVGAVGGAIIGGVTSAIGSGSKANVNSSSTHFNEIYTPGSGIASLFDDDEEARRKAARIQSNNIAKMQTEQIRSQYMMDPNVQTQPVLVAEGGIMRKPVDALVSKGELIYNPVTKKLSQVPGSKGKPNKKDDVYARLYEGDVVISNSPTMVMSNGKTPAQNLMGMVDKYSTGGTVKAREAIIKKVVNWQEANKTKPQEYAKFDEGIRYVDGQRAIYRHGRWWWNEGGKKDAQGKMYFVPYTGKSTPSETEPIKNTSETPVGPLDPAYKRHVPDTSVTSENKTVNKPSSGKKTTATSRVTTSTVPQEEKLTPEQIAESLRIADIGERHWLRGSVTEPKQSFTSLAKITPEKIKSQGIDNVAPLTGIKPSTDTTGTDNTGYTGSNWRDGLYRMAVLSQPLWDRAEAEPVNYESPVYKYMPTAIDVSSQLRDADQSYALSRYNFANLYPNTGAGMAAGLQAASNRAKQYADIRQWQTNAQNELIGKNVGIYNNWANEHARIMNDVYNKTAANRAAARNINRQNRAAALSNYGQMLRDDKQNAVERMKFAALKPAIQSTYEDASANDIYKWYKELFG